MAARIPSNVAGFAIAESLHEEQGIGRLLLGREKPGDELAVVKLIEDQDLRRHFLERAEFLKQLEHPNLVRTLACGLDEQTSRPWSAAPNVRGLSCAALLEIL